MIGKYVDLNNYNKLFSKMDQNSDGLISEEEFIEIIKQDKSLLNILLSEGQAAPHSIVARFTCTNVAEYVR